MKRIFKNDFFHEKNIKSLLIFCPALVIIFLIIFFGWDSTFSVILIDLKGNQIFGDFQNISSSTLSFLNDFDPRINNPYDLNNTKLIYPLTWVYIGLIFGLHNKINMICFILFFIILTFIIFYRLLKGNRSFKKTILSILIFYSHSNLLLIERGNIDIIIFVLTYFSIAIPNFFILTTFITIFLKIYTIPLLAISFNTFKKTIMIIVSIIIMGILFEEELMFSLNNIPVSPSFSYGSKVLGVMVNEIIGINLNHFFISISLIFLSFSIYLIGESRFNKILLDFNKFNQEKVRLFIAGSIVYTSTFFAAGNFDYRLIFLTFLLPILLELKKINFLISALIILLIMNQRLLKLIFSPIHEYLGTFINVTCKVFLLIGLTTNLIKYFDEYIFDNRINRVFRIKAN